MATDLMQSSLCSICQKKTFIIDKNSEKFFCSKKCQNKYYNQEFKFGLNFSPSSNKPPNKKKGKIPARHRGTPLTPPSEPPPSISPSLQPPTPTPQLPPASKSTRYQILELRENENRDLLEKFIQKKGNFSFCRGLIKPFYIEQQIAMDNLLYVIYDSVKKDFLGFSIVSDKNNHGFAMTSELRSDYLEIDMICTERELGGILLNYIKNIAKKKGKKYLKLKYTTAEKRFDFFIENGFFIDTKIYSFIPNNLLTNKNFIDIIDHNKDDKKVYMDLIINYDDINDDNEDGLENIRFMVFELKNVLDEVLVLKNNYNDKEKEKIRNIYRNLRYDDGDTEDDYKDILKSIKDKVDNYKYNHLFTHTIPMIKPLNDIFFDIVDRNNKSIIKKTGYDNMSNEELLNELNSKKILSILGRYNKKKSEILARDYTTPFISPSESPPLPLPILQPLTPIPQVPLDIKRNRYQILELRENENRDLLEKFIQKKGNFSFCRDLIKPFYIEQQITMDNLLYVIYDSINKEFLGFSIVSDKNDRGFAMTSERSSDYLKIDMICTERELGAILLNYIKNIAKKKGKKYLELEYMVSEKRFDFFIENGFFINSKIYSFIPNDLSTNKNFIDILDHNKDNKKTYMDLIINYDDINSWNEDGLENIRFMVFESNNVLNEILILKNNYNDKEKEKIKNIYRSLRYDDRDTEDDYKDILKSMEDKIDNYKYNHLFTYIIPMIKPLNDIFFNIVDRNNQSIIKKTKYDNMSNKELLNELNNNKMLSIPTSQVPLGTKSNRYQFLELRENKNRNLLEKFIQKSGASSFCGNLIDPDYINQQLKKDNWLYVVYDNEGEKFLGFSIVFDKNDYLEIDIICTEKGMGALLLSHIKNIAKKKGKKYLKLSSVKNKDTFNFYIRNGFFIDTKIYSFTPNDPSTNKNFIDIIHNNKDNKKVYMDLIINYDDIRDDNTDGLENIRSLVFGLKKVLNGEFELKNHYTNKEKEKIKNIFNHLTDSNSQYYDKDKDKNMWKEIDEYDNEHLYVKQLIKMIKPLNDINFDIIDRNNESIIKKTDYDNMSDEELLNQLNNWKKRPRPVTCKICQSFTGVMDKKLLVPFCDYQCQKIFYNNK
jgi:endogenous inhibitor of DNA gyrase (YacG/DUF329 family)